MSQTWRPVIERDRENYCRTLREFRDMFYTSLGPKGCSKLFEPSADGAPTKCTSNSSRILSSLKGLCVNYFSLWFINSKMNSQGICGCNINQRALKQQPTYVLQSHIVT